MRFFSIFCYFVVWRRPPCGSISEEPCQERELRQKVSFLPQLLVVFERVLETNGVKRKITKVKLLGK